VVAGVGEGPDPGVGVASRFARSGDTFRRVAENSWVRFLLRRFVSLVIVLVVLATASFALVRLIPGDPAEDIAGLHSTPAVLKAIRHQLGIDKPLLTQFADFWTALLHGNLGTSFQTSQPVSQVIAQHAPSSLELAGVSVLLVMVVSIPLGILIGAVTREERHKRFELGFTAVTSVVGSVPEYLTGTFLAFLFAVTFRLFPVAGTSGLKSLVLPALAISLRPIALLMRLVRVETLNVLATDYIRTVRSKRLPGRVVLVRHTLPNVIGSTLTIGGVLFAGIIGGAVVVENVFSRPGLGTELVNAVLSRDYPVVQGIILVLGVAVVVVNTAVDILIAILNPRSIARST
jgi:peptide/nickel transport system permease protein